jgi:hypothetical protein
VRINLFVQQPTVAGAPGAVGAPPGPACGGTRRPPAGTARACAAAVLLALAARAAVAVAGGPAAAPQGLAPADIAAAYARQVDRRLELPVAEQQAYARLLWAALAAAGVVAERPQYALLVDRSPHVQAAMVWWLDPPQAALLVGASPVSTGRPSGFEHFETPLGVFEHSLANPDFRAEGTRNEFGIRGYGDKGMRVYDFGWVMAQRAWRPGEQPMRLQVHATDPVLLEPRLGQRESKGCIRIPAALNRLLDRHGLLDADYEDALAAGRALWVLLPDRQPAAWPGRYLVIVDSLRSARPDWARPPAPQRPQPSRKGSSASQGQTTPSSTAK